MMETKLDSFLDAAGTDLAQRGSGPRLGIDTIPGNSIKADHQHLRRPWTQHWPVSTNSELFKWLQQVCPEAISWRWNPQNPFDRPWQRWLKQKPSTAPMVNRHLNEHDAHLFDSKPRKFSEVAAQGQALHHEQTELTLSECDTQPCLTTFAPVELRYLADKDLYLAEKPYSTRLPFLDHLLQRTNIVAESHNNVRIRDVSGHEDLFKIDIHGFEFCKSQGMKHEWSDDNVRLHYLPSISDWLRERFQCQQVHVYGYNFRCQDRQKTGNATWLGPLRRVHSDVSERASSSRLDLHLPGQADNIRKQRYRFIGTWQLLSEPPVDCPLALCDSRSIRGDDLVPSDVVFPHYCDEYYEVRYSPHHRWYFKDDMKSDDIILMKMFDSDNSVAQFCAHSAFQHPAQRDVWHRRASLEVRAILVG